MNILIDMPVFSPVLKSLQNIPEVNIKMVASSDNARNLPEELIAKTDVLFCTTPPLNHHKMTSLKMIQISSAGYSQLIGEKFDERNIKACNALGVFDVPIAEWNIAMMINLARNLRGMLRNQDNQVWDRSAQFQTEIRGRIVGLWGYGGIGRETARQAKALGMKIHVLTRSGVNSRENKYRVPETGDNSGILPDRVFLMDEVELFLKELDFLIMSVPQTAATLGIVGEEELKLLKPTAFILNPARGPIIQEQPLIRALKENWIAGAALDTHYYYPMPEKHPLWKMENVILTPHISGSSNSSYFLERIWDIFFENIKRMKNGEPLLNEISTSELKGH